MLVAMASPKSAVASFPAGTKSTFFAPAASTMSACRSVPGSCQSGFFTKSAVGDTVALTSTLVRLSFIFESASEPEVTTRSQPSTRSAAPVPTRTEWSSSGEGAILTCDITGPNF